MKKAVLCAVLLQASLSFAGSEDALIEKASLSSALVEKALAHEKAQRHAVADDIKARLDLVRQLNEESTLDLELLYSKIKTYITRQKELAGIFNESLKGKPVSIPLSSNKMVEVLDLALKLIDTENYLFDLLDGKVPAAYAFDQDEVAVLAMQADTIWGNSKATALKTALFAIERQLKGGEVEFPNLYYHTFFHAVSMNPVVYQQIIAEKPELREYDFLVNYDDDENHQVDCALITIHSGYAFGGQRPEPIDYCQRKKFGPEDCSSGVAKLTNCNIPLTTQDLFYVYRTQMAEPVVEPALADITGWQGRVGAALTAKYPVVRLNDPENDVRPGHIYATRRFLPEDPTRLKTVGCGGHTAIFLGWKGGSQDLKALTLGYNRDMPNLEGFGLQEFPLRPAGNATVMFFDVK